MPTYMWMNSETEEVKEWTSKISERNDFLKTVDDPDNWSRVPDAMVTSTRNSETYIGHTPTARKDQMRLYSEQLKATAKMQSQDHDKRGDMKKEIQKIQKGLDKTT